MAKRRLDALLAERGLVPSRTRAAESVRAGLVRVGRGGERPTKPSLLVAEDAELAVEEGRRYVSRGGIKLENGLAALTVEVEGRDCLDAGASTGGFTDCLLKHGAARVIALDVARGQLDWGLRNDDRVHVMEDVNARSVAPGELPWTPELAVVDVSFISLAKVLPALADAIDADGDILALVKPQFELGRGRVKGGVVRDPADRREALTSVVETGRRLDLAVAGIASSGLPGPKGNRESFVWFSRSQPGLASIEDAVREVEP